MTRVCGLMAGCALFVLSGVAAHADCSEDLAALEGGAGQGAPGAISKDGSLAPLEGAGAAPASEETADFEAASGGETTGPASPGAESQASGGEIIQDGTHAPLEGAGAEVATSGQDAQAQQAGDETAAQQAETGPDQATRTAAIERAHAALAAGDEAGCNAALEEARNS